MIDSSECVELLIKSGLDVNGKDERGNTPTMVACFLNKPRILKSLLSANADITIKNNEGKDAAAICDERDSDECKAIIQQK
ncbi:unnamed protein product [Rotaria sp. Silwood2]|nr:unnamed protein product [Rotaria sp. Silwood2]CAF3610909.1 unnamed protein product [Rotaria sp. Silwood2]CAF4885636.1 unnamed protein product [Rotaria sp. Silwood2]